MKKMKAPYHRIFRIVSLMFVVPFWLVSHVSLKAKDQHDWQRDIDPILNDHCVKCHGPLKTKADLDLSTFHGLIKGGENGPVVLAGEAESSPLYQVLLKDADPHMPPKKQLPDEAIENIRLWIQHFQELPTSFREIRSLIFILNVACRLRALLQHPFAMTGHFNAGSALIW